MAVSTGRKDEEKDWCLYQKVGRLQNRDNELAREKEEREYERNKPRHYSKMIVLYVTSSRSHAGHMETQLIDHNWDRLELRNEIGGGGGPYGEGWYYLYIVCRRRKP